MTQSSDRYPPSAGIARGPRVSVITIFRNERRFLSEAIASVVGQTLGDWELLLVDDGSTDGSSAFAQERAWQRPDQIRYFEHPAHANRGMSASRNLGLAEARGEYVAFLDGDDVFLPERLERHLAVLDSTPAVDMVQSDLIHWHSWQPASSRREEDYVRPCVCFTDRVLPAPLGLWASLVTPELYPGICSLTVRRPVALELGGFEGRFRSLYEDQVFLTKVYAQKRIYVVEDYLALYRIHAASTVERLKGKAHVARGVWQAESLAFADWRLRYLRSLPDRTGALGIIIHELAMQQAAVHGVRLAGGIHAAKRAVNGVLETVLPPAVYSRILARRRRLAGQRTLDRYEALCHRTMPAVERVP